MTEAATKSEDNVLVGGVLISTAFFLLAVMGALGKAAAELPASMIVFFQNGVAFAMLLPWALRRGTADLKTKRFPLLLFRSFAGLFAFALMFIAMRDMPLIGVMVLSQAAPLFIPLIALVWLQEKITTMVIVSVLIGLLGVLVYIRPSPALLDNPAALLAVASAFLVALALIAVHQLAQTEKPDTILFYYFLVCAVASAPFAIMQWKEPENIEWAYLIGIGASMAAMQFVLIIAYHYASAQRLAPFNYTIVIFSGLIGWAVWEHVPDALNFVGIALICVGGLMSVFYGGAHSKSVHHGQGHRTGHLRRGKAQSGAKA